MGAIAAEAEVDRIMSTVDMDANGAIDYSEFIAATVNKTKLLTKERMKQAFEHFDKNRSGFINLAEIKTILDQGKKIDDRVWKQMIKEVDINGDGEISY
jgi:calcium-dependent protein kinase